MFEETEEYIRQIVANGNQEDMEELSIIFNKVLHKLEKYDRKCAEKYEMKLYVTAYGENLTREMAEEIVHKMKPYGEHWKIEDTSAVKLQYALNDISDVDFYIVMNMAYNDYKEVFDEDLNTYVKFSKAFIQDEDARSGKVFRYFTKI